MVAISGRTCGVDETFNSCFLSSMQHLHKTSNIDIGAGHGIGNGSHATPQHRNDATCLLLSFYIASRRRGTEAQRGEIKKNSTIVLFFLNERRFRTQVK